MTDDMELSHSPIDSSEELLGKAAGEFFDALANGEQPSVDEFAERYPSVAEHIIRTFPALLLFNDASSTAAREGVEQRSCAGRLGDFLILRELGRGGMGVVYEAEQISLGRRVALKVLPFAAMLDKQQLARFKNEARAAATLQHPNIVSIHSVGVERGVHYYAMQLIEGRSLAEIISAMKPNRSASKTAADSVTCVTTAPTAADTAKMALPTVHTGGSIACSSIPPFGSKDYFHAIARLGVQAAEALGHAHSAGILHRDIKPANLLLDDDGKLWIADFGLARIDADAGMTMTGDLLGTLRYMSPEQVLGKRAVVDQRSDIYSLGITLYELLTLNAAFPGENHQDLLSRIATDEPPRPSTLNRKLPVDLETIILKSIENDTTERFATATEFADDLKRFLNDQAIKAKPASLGARLTKWSRRHVVFLWAVATVLFISTLLFVGASVRVSKWYQEAELQRAAASEQLLNAQKLEIEARSAQRKEMTALASAERSLYISNMQSIPTLWKSGQLGLLHEKLDALVPQDGRTDNREWEWYYALAKCHDDVRTIYSAADPKCVVRWNPANDLLAAVDATRKIKIWNAVDGRALKALGAPGQQYLAVQWSPDGALVAGARAGGEFDIWDAVRGEVVRTFQDPLGNSVQDAKWSPDGRYIATEGMRHPIRVWDATSGTLLQEFPPEDVPDDRPYLAWNSDSNRIAYCRNTYGRYAIRIWDVKEKRHLETLDCNASGYIRALDWSADEDRLAAGYLKSAGVWDVANQVAAQTFDQPTNAVVSVAWRPSKDQIAMGGDDCFVRICDVATGNEVTKLWGHVSGITCVSWNSDGSRLASSDSSGMIKIWNVKNPTPSRVTSLAEESIQSIAWDAGGTRLAILADRGQVFQLDEAGNVQNLASLAKHTGSLGWSDEGRLTSGGMEGKDIVFWDAETGKEQSRQAAPNRLANGGTQLAWSNDGQRFASVHKSRGVAVWEVPQGKQLSVCSSGEVSCAAWNGTSDELAIGNFGEMEVWNPGQGKLARRISLPQASRARFVSKIAWSHNSTRIAAFTSEVGWIANALSGKVLALLRGHVEGVNCVAFSPSGSRVASTEPSHVIIWDAATGDQITQIADYPGKLRGAVWAPDGVRLALFGSSGVMILDASRGNELAHGPDYDLDRQHRIAATGEADEIANP
jgi:eukaryotic-like serine/threonine-protein kinase